MRSLGLILLGCTLVACTSPGVVDGTVKGNALDVKDVVFQSDSPQKGMITILLVDQENVCDRVETIRLKKNASYLGFGLLNHAPGNKDFLPLIPGDYTVISLDSGGEPPTQAAIGYFNRLDATCKSMVPDDNADVRSGVVTITKFSEGQEIEGTFDVTVGAQGDRLTGRFAGTYCEPTIERNERSCS